MGFDWKDTISRFDMSRIISDHSVQVFLLANNLEFDVEVFDIFDTKDRDEISITQFIFGCHYLTSCTRSTDNMFLSGQLSRLCRDTAFMSDRVKAQNHEQALRVFSTSV